ncbi:neurofilament heavy polypeptide [Rhodamnia argentea]|uniref:Neurofilament heavy polypeptide n=1 Tax=Rhodamnia argentea TaxID=178133 RepID=A0A8B8QH44_9MYRT|nr:neurofilament heavy polypeptide [Rhodamnia argentea]
MSVLEYPDAMDAPELQIWNNAAFDNGESEDSAAAVALKASWSSVNPVFVKLSESLESDDFSKENRSPECANSQISLKSSIPSKLQSKQSVLEPLSTKAKDPEDKGRTIDAEIQELEKEISRLSSRLEALRLEKAKTGDEKKPRGRVVAAKFMEPKQVGIGRDPDAAKRIEETPLSSAKPKLNRRGLSLGPAEIASSAVKSRPSIKGEITPALSIQNRRKSCFWKLEEIDELKVTKERRKSISATTSPGNARKTFPKIQPQKQAATTAASRRFTKKEEAIIASIQPKRLFKDGEKSVPTKKPGKPGRVVASRYSQITMSAARKRSFPENNNKDEGERVDKRRASAGLNTQGNESKVKKKWEIPSELVVYESKKDDSAAEAMQTPSSIGRISNMLPKITAVRFVNESPRDSGAARRVADLVGRRNYFGGGGNVEEVELQMPFCPALSFIQDDE